MNNHSELQVPGMETHGHSVQSVSATPSPEFLHDVAALPGRELNDIILVEPDSVGTDGKPVKLRRLEGEYSPWEASSGRDVLQDRASLPSP